QATPLAGHRTGAVVSHTDITWRKTAEEQLRQANDELEERVAKRTAELDRVVKGLRKEVAQRRRAEITLRVSNEKMNRVLSAMGAGLLIVNSGGTIEYQNDIHRKWFGDMEKRSLDECSGISSFKEAVGMCRKAAQKNRAKTFETEHGLGNLIFEQSFSLFTDIDGQEKLIVLQRDVSEKKRLETETARAARLASVGELAAGVAHEINNPINGIINYAQILEDEIEENPELGQIPARILKESERVASIVGNLLSFARENNDERVPAKIPDILADALELMGKQLSKDGIRLQAYHSAETAPAVVNPQKIQQVFVNLINNARHALNSRHPGFHRNKLLKARIYEICENGRNFIRTEIIDHGTGIDSGDLERICDPFFSTKPAGKGTGLGLSISYGIAEDHGGRLDFDSKKEHYTRVRLELPAADRGTGVSQAGHGGGNG
ncbi:MAG: ATP-binding protein, partial [Desulfosalsimonas sp.]